MCARLAPCRRRRRAQEIWSRCHGSLPSDLCHPRMNILRF
nr:MAG TPA: hypothetical protein [Bacteriophage sp.]